MSDESRRKWAELPTASKVVAVMFVAAVSVCSVITLICVLGGLFRVMYAVLFRGW